MKVILLKSIPNLGDAGQSCEVKEGYAKNYLLARGLAALPGNKLAEDLAIDAQKKVKEKELQRKQLVEVLDRMKSTPLKFSVKVNKNGQLFAGINQQLISQKIKELYKVEPSKLQGLPIKQTGEYKIKAFFNDLQEVEIGVVVNKE